jgi:hypothetical protein
MMQHRYQDGTEIHVGNRVIYNYQVGTIVLVADQNEYSPQYPKEDYPSITNGFMIRFDNGALLVLDESDELLVRDKNDTVDQKHPPPQRQEK